MEQIHLKTVDPVSQALLQSAAARGLDLNWERYERLQPQDGFLRTGLSCPFGCLQGPCRIDPFGRGADVGICGVDRDRMAAALLLRLSLNGVLEAMNDLSADDHTVKTPAWPGAMGSRAACALEALGGDELVLDEIYQCAARLHRPSDKAADLIRCCLRLAMLTLTLTEGSPAEFPNQNKVPCRIGYGLMAAENPIVAICGPPSASLLGSLADTAASDGPRLGLVALGDWVADDSGYLPIACTSGEAELLLSSGRISLLVCGAGTDPAVAAICSKLKIPVISGDADTQPDDIVRLAETSFNSRTKTDFFRDLPPAVDNEIVMNAAAFQTELNNDGQKGLALIGGSDSLHQPFGWISTEVGPVLAGAGLLVAGWGDAAIWMVKGEQTGNDKKMPVRLLDPRRGPVEALKAVAASDAFDRLKGVCYTGLNSCRDLNLALALAMLGTRVCIGTPLPLWGSRPVRDHLAVLVEACNGELAHFDHPADANQILQWFRHD